MIAETDDLEKNALGKLRAKGLDLIAANIVGDGKGFASSHNELHIYGKGGLVRGTGVVTKEEAARVLMDCASDFMKS